jgi:predicted SnoaL-like aldol condensation-catalyzing enzyme
MHRWLAALLLAAGAAPTHAAAPPPPTLPTGQPRPQPQENADQRIARAFRQAACGPLAARAAAGRFLATDFRNHNVEQPSGAQTYVGYLTKPAEYGNPNPPSAAAVAPSAPLFAITDGNLTMLAPPGPAADPGARFAANLIELQNRHVTQIWYSGPATADPAAAPLPDDPSACFPAAAPPLVPTGAATADQRAANKQRVAQFIQDFFVDGNTGVAARVLAPNLASHVPGVPSGRDFAAIARKHQDRVVAPNPAQPLFVLADGELVDIGFPVAYASDPGAWFAQTIVRVQNGKITEWWYSGYPAGHPRHAWKMPKP